MSTVTAAEHFKTLLTKGNITFMLLGEKSHVSILNLELFLSFICTEILHINICYLETFISINEFKGIISKVVIEMVVFLERPLCLTAVFVLFLICLSCYSCILILFNFVWLLLEQVSLVKEILVK